MGDIDANAELVAEIIFAIVKLFLQPSPPAASLL